MPARVILIAAPTQRKLSLARRQLNWESRPSVLRYTSIYRIVHCDRCIFRLLTGYISLGIDLSRGLVVRWLVDEKKEFHTDRFGVVFRLNPIDRRCDITDRCRVMSLIFCPESG